MVRRAATRSKSDAARPGRLGGIRYGDGELPIDAQQLRPDAQFAPDGPPNGARIINWQQAYRIRVETLQRFNLTTVPVFGKQAVPFGTTPERPVVSALFVLQRGDGEPVDPVTLLQAA